MKKNNCKSWSEGLRFVQLMKNRAYDDGIKRSPYMAMFGTDVKIGLSSSLLQAETGEKLITEQNLEEILQSVVSNYEQRENHSVSDKDVNCWQYIVVIPDLITSTFILNRTVLYLIAVAVLLVMNKHLFVVYVIKK